MKKLMLLGVVVLICLMGWGVSLFVCALQRVLDLLLSLLQSLPRLLLGLFALLLSLANLLLRLLHLPLRIARCFPRVGGIFGKRWCGNGR